MKYDEIEDFITTKIKTGEYVADEKIPSENQLAEIFSVSRMTVHKAIDNLVARNYLFRLPKKGIYVLNLSEKYTIYLDELNGFTTRAERLGKKSSSKVIKFELKEPSTLIKTKMKLEKNEKIFYIERARLLNEEPIIFEINYIRQNKVENLSMLDAQKSIEQYLKQNDIQVKRVEKEFVASMPDKKIKEALGLSNNTTLLRIDYTNFDQDNEVFKFTKVFYNQNKCRFLQIIDII